MQDFGEKILEEYKENRREALKEVVTPDGYNYCGFRYERYFGDKELGFMSEQMFQKWYDEHCAKCPCMKGTCMADVLFDHTS